MDKENKEKSCDVATKENKELQSLEGNIHIVNIGLKSIVRGFYTVGKTLTQIQKYESYKLKGFNNFYDFTLSAFKLSKSHTSRLINVYNRFPGSNYESFSFSQLTEMLALPDDKLSEIKPEMTIKQIREVKKEVKKDEDKIIKKKDKIEFGKQVDIADVVTVVDKNENEVEELVNVANEIERLETVNKIIKNRKDVLESKHENLKKLNRDNKEEINSLKSRLELSKISMDNLIKRDNQAINELKNDNANLLSQLADMQKMLKEKDLEIECLKDVNELLKKQVNEYVTEKKSKRTRIVKKDNS